MFCFCVLRNLPKSTHSHWVPETFEWILLNPFWYEKKSDGYFRGGDHVMASYTGHFRFSAVLAVGTGAIVSLWLQFDWGATLLVVALTIVGGLTPDLDSASGIPVRELFGLASIVAPIFLAPRLKEELGLTADQQLAMILILYFFVKYGLCNIFKHFTVHRGMFHSIPTMLILGFLVFLATKHSTAESDMMLHRIVFALVAMIGFFGHLVLDEIYSINLDGMAISVNQFSGTAVKFIGPSMPSNIFCYSLLGLAGFGSYQDTNGHMDEVKSAFTAIQSKMLSKPSVPNWFDHKTDGKPASLPAPGHAQKELAPMPGPVAAKPPVASVGWDHPAK